MLKNIIRKTAIFLALIFVARICCAQIVKQNIPDKLIVFTFDDATASQYSVVAPLLKKYGFGATFFICEFPPNFSDTTKYMNWRQISELHKMGFEIANHTRNHPHVTKISKEEFIEQLEYIEHKCDSLKISHPATFAYPGYSLNLSAIEVLEAKGYVFARAGGERPYNPEVDHPMLIPSWAMKSDNKKEVMHAFQQAHDGKIVVLTIHGVPDIEHPWVNTPPELFEEYLRFLKENNYKVIALRDLKKFVDIDVAMKEITPDLSKKLKN